MKVFFARCTSCPSFNLLNRVQEDGQGARGRARKGCFSLRLCEQKKGHAKTQRRKGGIWGASRKGCFSLRLCEQKKGHAKTQRRKGGIWGASRKGRFSLRLCGFASKKIPRPFV
jgi:hypothetical protein